MNYDYYEHYSLWCTINKLPECEDTWIRFIDEELTDGEGM